MNKPSGSSLPWLYRQHKSSLTKTEHSATHASSGIFKLEHFRIVVLLVILLLSFSAPVLGQAVNATLLGTVTDSSAAPVARVKVTITQTNTGIVHNSQTNDSGNPTW